jgi:quinol monooxygenase YgiN
MVDDVNSQDSRFIALFKLKISEENQQKATEIINFVIERVRVESGCKNFQFYRDITKSDSFLLLQEWASKAVFEKHIHSNEFRHVLTLIDLANELPKISFNTISQQEGLGLITSLKENTPGQE